MSRLHQNVPHTTNDILANCESYMSKLIKPRVQRPCHELQNEIVKPKPRAKSTGRTCNQIVTKIPPKPPNTPVTAIQEPSSQQLIHKEVFNNNMATVEVTVRTTSQKNQRGSRSKNSTISEDKREPWGQLLHARKSQDTVTGSFCNFDPLRTLHFLSKELQFKLQTVCPGNKNIQQMLNDMQNAIERLPPDVISQLRLNQENVNSEASKKKTHPQALKDSKSNQSTQTAEIYESESKKMQKQLEESASKLEASCKQMEDTCLKLRIDKHELQTLLAVEKETVNSLKKELDDRISEKEMKTSRELQKLLSERDSLQSKIKRLQSELECYAGGAALDLRTLIQQLRDKQLTTEQENSAIRNQLTIMKLEKDKMNVLLDSRDKQLRELRTELDNIQSFVSSQLCELQIKPTVSQTTTITSSLAYKSPVKLNSGKSVHELYKKPEENNMCMENDSLTSAYDEFMEYKEEFLKNDNNRQENPQRDKTSHQTKTRPSNVIDMADVSTTMEANSIKQMFAHIKRQALGENYLNDLSLPSPPRPFTISSIDSSS